MHPNFSSRLNTLIVESMAGSYKVGWVYGRLKQEFDLQPDELNVMASALGFKRGWNPGLQNLLETQWQAEEDRWREREQQKCCKQLEQQKRQVQDRLNREKLQIQNQFEEEKLHLRNQIFLQEERRVIGKLQNYLQELQASEVSTRELTDIERVLITLILNMRVEEQAWALSMVLNRYQV